MPPRMSSSAGVMLRPGRRSGVGKFGLLGVQEVAQSARWKFFSCANHCTWRIPQGPRRVLYILLGSSNSNCRGISWCRSLRGDYRPRDVLVSCVCPEISRGIEGLGTCVLSCCYSSLRPSFPYLRGRPWHASGLHRKLFSWCKLVQAAVWFRVFGVGAAKSVWRGCASSRSPHPEKKRKTGAVTQSRDSTLQVAAHTTTAFPCATLGLCEPLDAAVRRSTSCEYILRLMV